MALSLRVEDNSYRESARQSRFRPCDEREESPGSTGQGAR